MTEKNIKTEWHGKPYYSLDAWCKNTLGRKCYKIALNAHMTCPNRDGSLDTRGCIFCSAGGSGDFAVDTRDKNVEEQLREGLALFQTKKFAPCPTTTAAHATSTGISKDMLPCLIAYFQAYTNTYAPVTYLRKVYTEALDCPAVCGISIATRPDCLPDEVLALLAELNAAYPDKFIWVELGLQTIHEQTARFLRRGYELPCFENALKALKAIGIPVIVHLILGLPGETSEMILEDISYLNDRHPFGVKLQLLHILKDTELGDLYLHASGTPAILPLTMDGYLTILIECIRRLSSDIVIHRLTGDGPKSSLLAPLWSLDKRNVLNNLHKQMKTMNAIQGDFLCCKTH